VDAHQENIAKPPYFSAAGVVPKPFPFRFLEPPRLRRFGTGPSS